jgi:hypothetical protein
VNVRIQDLTLALSALNLTALLAAAAWPRSTVEPVLRGRALELVDATGQLRARLDVEPSGEVVLRLLDEKGTIRVKLGAGRSGSGLLLANDATEPGVHLLAKSDVTSLRLATKDGRERVITP